MMSEKEDYTKRRRSESQTQIWRACGQENSAMKLPRDVWIRFVHPCCVVPALVALSRTCQEQRDMAQSQLMKRWGWGESDVYRAIKRMHQYFARSLALAHAKGLQHVSRKFLDGTVSGLTAKDVREYERMIHSTVGKVRLEPCSSGGSHAVSHPNITTPTANEKPNNPPAGTTGPHRNLPQGQGRRNQLDQHDIS